MGIRRRVLLLAGLWTIPPALVLGLGCLVNPDRIPVHNAVLVPASLTFACSGWAWKDSARVRKLLTDGENPLMVVPVRSPAASGPGRALRDAFVVLTERRLLLYGHDRFLDVPTRLLHEADRDTVAFGLRDGRVITVPTPTGTLELTARPRHLPPPDRLAAVLHKPPHPPRPSRP
ncbi:hypothetical protein OG897_21500 [Streptomyces sp. NBC_00237]|uniref:hypothetical protein n=1 Tax=Streptomyces sp. NBC_00237 TaxID=2975687 RepID=UPI00224D702D|nr:hypothetical protein [Streptomyces sp. NBC_00237]MCX5204014.1 hypothetical protein [Streptomyces sp. NBC_00237]